MSLQHSFYSTVAMNMTAGAPIRATATRTRLVVIFNPTAGNRRRRRLEAFLAALRAGGATPTLLETTAAGDARAFALAAREEGCEALVVAGGDGTINEAADGLTQALPGAGPVTLGLLPLGTANVLARELGIPRDPRAAAAVILAGRRRRMTLGEANGRAFALMAGVGFDAAVVAHLDPALKRRLRQGAYIWETLRQAFRFRFPRYRVTAGGETFEARSVIACKASHYGGPFVLAPQASPERPALTLVLFQRAGPLAVLRFGLDLLLGRMHRSRGVRLVDCATAEVSHAPGEPASGPEAVQGDGDVIARLPLSLRIRERPLAVFAPPPKAVRQEVTRG